MKKALLYFFAFLFICFFLPTIFTKVNIPASTQSQTPENQEEPAQQEGEKQENYQDITIQLLHAKTGEVEQVNLEEWVKR